MVVRLNEGMSGGLLQGKASNVRDVLRMFFADLSKAIFLNYAK